MSGERSQMDRLISLQAAIAETEWNMSESVSITRDDWRAIIEGLKTLPSAQPAEAIPVAYLEEQAKRFESMDNAFAKIEANNIRVLIKRWRSEKDERPD